MVFELFLPLLGGIMSTKRMKCAMSHSDFVAGQIYDLIKGPSFTACVVNGKMQIVDETKFKSLLDVGAFKPASVSKPAVQVVKQNLVQIKETGLLGSITTQLTEVVSDAVVEVAKDVSSAELSDKITEIVEKKLGLKLTVLKNLPLVGDVSGLATPLLALAISMLFPDDKNAKIAEKVASHALSGNLHVVMRPLAKEASSILSEVSGLSGLLSD